MKMIISVAIAAMGLAAAAPAEAQGIPVHDNLSYIQMIEQVTNSGTQIEKAVAQIQQLQQTYQSFSHLTNAASVASLLNNSAIRNVLPPEVTNMATLLSGNPSATGALGTIARQFQQQYALPAQGVAGNPVNTAYASYLDAVNGGAANMMALGSNTLAVGGQRTAGLTELQSRISSAQDPKDVMDLNVRATIESAQATNDLMKLQAIQLSQAAQSDLLLKQYWVSRSRAANATEYDAVRALTSR